MPFDRLQGYESISIGYIQFFFETNKRHMGRIPHPKKKVPSENQALVNFKLLLYSHGGQKKRTKRLFLESDAFC